MAATSSSCSSAKSDGCTSSKTTAQRILERLRTPFNLGLIEVYTGCSIGIALYPEHGDRLEALIRCADTAMYVAKDDGKRTYRVFSPEMNKKVAEYMWLDTNLRRGLEEQPTDAPLPAQAVARPPAPCTASKRWCAGTRPNAA